MSLKKKYKIIKSMRGHFPRKNGKRTSTTVRNGRDRSTNGVRRPSRLVQWSLFQEKYMTRRLTAQRLDDVSRPTPKSLTPVALSRRAISGSTIVIDSAMPKWPKVIHITLRHISFRSE